MKMDLKVMLDLQLRQGGWYDFLLFMKHSIKHTRIMKNKPVFLKSTGHCQGKWNCVIVFPSLYYS
jgi:hypothetical protein